MKDYWYVPAIAGICSVLTKLMDSTVIFIPFFIWLGYLYYTRRLGKIPIIISLSCFIFFFLYIPQVEPITTSNQPTEMGLSGKIVSPITATDTILQFEFREKKTHQLIKIVHFNPNLDDSRFSMIHHGAKCQITGEVGFPEGSRNPGQFDYQQYLATKGIQYEMPLSQVADIVCHGKSVQSLLYSLRSEIKRMVNSEYSPETSAWMNALVLGDDSQISEQTTELFKRWGLSHLLAISGLHIGLVVGLLYFLFIRLNWVTREKAQNIILVFLPIYALLAGGEPSVWRASIMVLIVILLQKIGRRLSGTDVISITFLLLLLLDKFIVYQIGFQLSFLVAFAIILSRKWLMEKDSLFFQLVKLSFIAQLIIIPLQIIYFYNVNPLSILLNVFVVPYFSFFVIPLMFILFIATPIPFLSDFMDLIFVHVHQYLFLLPLEFIDQIAYFPWLTGIFPPLLIILYFGLFIAMMGMMEKGKRLGAFSIGTILTLVLFLLVVRPYLSPYGTVTMLDIGQGDAFVLELPYRKGVVLIDAGANFSFDESETASDSNYNKIIKPFLQYKGIQKIDAIFITHEDVDHAGSVNYIVNDFLVETIIISEFYQVDETSYRNWIEKGVEVLRVKAGHSLDIKGKMFTILSPRVDKKSNNENSLVIHTTLGNEDWLFTGDIGKETEKGIVQNYPELDINTLKIAHHGSSSSSDPAFIAEVHPATALISVGRNNLYGHPSQETINLLENKGITVLRTDLQGAIIYRFTKDRGTFYQFIP